MEKVITIKEFRSKVGTFLKEVSQGEEIVLTFHGKPMVRIVNV